VFVVFLQIVHKMLHAGMSSHPDFENLRGLGTTYLDQSIEPGRWTTYITQTDQDQTSSEWIDIDIEMETKLNTAYDEVGGLGRGEGGGEDMLSGGIVLCM
jgi:hypothetical protein